MPVTIPTERVDFDSRWHPVRGVVDAARRRRTRTRRSCWCTDWVRRTT